MQAAFARTTLAQAIHGFEVASPEERRALLPLMLGKAKMLAQEPDAARRKVLAARFTAAMRLPLRQPQRELQPH